MNLLNKPGTGEPLRVILAEDHPVVRNGIRMLIDAEPDMT